MSMIESCVPKSVRPKVDIVLPILAKARTEMLEPKWQNDNTETVDAMRAHANTLAVEPSLLKFLIDNDDP
jgi:hypothetical protein